MPGARVAIVTGASRCIGAATALLLAQHGYAVCIYYLNNRENAGQLVARIRGANGSFVDVAGGL